MDVGDRSAAENWSVLARFVWRKLSLRWSRDHVPEQEVRFSDLGLSDDRDYLVYEFWSRRFLGRSKHVFSAPEQTPENGLQVFAIREARNHPWVLSTSRHISQGGVDLVNLQWDGSSRVLAGQSAVIGKDPYRIAVYLPEGFEFSSMESAGLRADIKRYDDHLTATVVPKRTGTINWSMKFANKK